MKTLCDLARYLRRVGHRGMNRLASSASVVGEGGALPLTLAWLDTLLLPVRRSTTLRGTLSCTPLLQDTISLTACTAPCRPASQAAARLLDSAGHLDFVTSLVGADTKGPV